MIYMTELKAEGITDIPSTVNGSGRIVVAQPTLDEVRFAAEPGWGEQRSVVIGCVAIKIIDGNVSRAIHQVFTLKMIRDVVYDMESDELRFTGRTSYSYDHTSYNQTSRRTEHTFYQVVLRTSLSESSMHAIANPHPVKYTY